MTKQEREERNQRCKESMARNAEIRRLRYEVIKTLKDQGWSAEKTNKALHIPMGRCTVDNFYKMIDDGHEFTFE